MNDLLIDAAARSILARRAEATVASWEVVRTMASPGSEQAIDARLAEYAKHIRAGALTEADTIAELRDQIRQLTYERSLLTAARDVLDLVADLTMPVTDHTSARAGVIAERIADEIGHLFSDEPALGPDMRDQLARVKALTDWMRESNCALGGDQIDALLVDPRPTADLIAARHRTGHCIGCDCPTCTTTN